MAKAKRFVSIDIALIASTHYSFRHLDWANLITSRLKYMHFSMVFASSEMKYSTKKKDSISLFILFALLQLLKKPIEKYHNWKMATHRQSKRSVSTGNFKNACCLISLCTFALFFLLSSLRSLQSANKKKAFPRTLSSVADSCLYAFALSLILSEFLASIQCYSLRKSSLNFHKIFNFNSHRHSFGVHHFSFLRSCCSVPVFLLRSFCLNLYSLWSIN